MAKVYGIDLDDVSFDFTPAFGNWLRDKLNITYNDHDVVDYRWYRCIPGMSENDFYKELENFADAGMYAKIPIVAGAVRAINLIREHGHKIWFVTARHAYAKRDTLAAVKNAFGIHEKQIVFSRGPDFKAEAVRLLNIDVFIEDGPHYAESIANNTQALVYLMDKPYNKNVEHQKIIRVSSWDEVLQEEGLYENRNTAIR